MILRSNSPDEAELEDVGFVEQYQVATDLYGLVHARFILSSKGLNLMREKFLQGRFGTCPKVFCEKQHVLPIGLSEDLKTARVKVYCPKCQEIYFPKKKCTEMDGAYFGQSFPHVLLQHFRDILPTRQSDHYVPRIFGFKIRKEPPQEQSQQPAKPKPRHK
jgi:casein kinase II subunit beta